MKQRLMTGRPARRLLCVAVTGALLSGWASAANAQASVTPGEVFIVLAKEEPGEVDPALKDMPALRRAPFSSFKSLRLLGRPALALEAGKPATLDLPNGRKIQVTLQGTLPDGRYRVRVAINRPDKKDYLPLLQVAASPGDPFFVAGQGHDGGTLVVGVRIGQRAEKPAK